MPVNDFEKQVQQKMDELQLRPSAEVWEEVEKRIRKEKKRRWLILWGFIAGALLLGGASWWLANGNKKESPDGNSVAQTTTTTKKNDITINTKNENISDKKIESVIKSKSEISGDSQPTKKITATETKAIGDKTELGAIKAQKPIWKETKTENPVSTIAKKNNAKKDKAVLQDISKTDQPLVAKNNVNSDIVIKKDKITTADMITTKPDSAGMNKSIVVINDPVNIKQENISEPKDSLITKQIETAAKKDAGKIKINKSKWEIGITALVGTSNKSDGISFFGMMKSLDASNLNSSPGPGQSVTSSPAQPGNGFAWHAGVYVKRILSERVGLSVGLNFSTYSSTQFTGAFVDSSRTYNNNLYSFSARNFYRSGAASLYKNHYYYLELPVSFHWQINKGKKVPLIFHNGLAAGFFTGSDALVYNSGSNVFYKDNKSFNKVQLAYQSGLYAKLFNRSKNPLTAGVLFNYHFSKLQKVNINGGNHLSSFGIQLGWILKK